MKERNRLIITLVVLLGIALSFIAYLSFPLLTGRTTVLATLPIDPFDILRGQYLTINYEISSIPSIQEAKEGDAVYVVLEEDKDKISRYKSASLDIPQADFIKGTVTRNNGDTLRVEYGIEQYFFERNADVPAANLTVEVKISKSGQARISRLLQDGKPVEIIYKNASLTS